MKEKPSFTSLYCGCGGLDLGFIQAGYSCVAAYDNDQRSIHVHKQNLATNAYVIDLSNLTTDVISNIKASDALLAGPPCQGFSTAGKNDPKDLRNSHIVNVAKAAALAKPKIVLIENVRGLLSKNGALHFENTLNILKSAGYSVSYDLHNSVDYGVPQKRSRVLILATLSSSPIQLTLRCLRRTTIKEVLKGVHSNLSNDAVTFDENSKEKAIAQRIKPGQKLSNVRSGLNNIHTWEIPEVFGKVTEEEVTLLETIRKLRRRNRRRESGDADPVDRALLIEIFGKQIEASISNLIKIGYLRTIGKYIDITNTFNGKYRRLVWDEAAPTVDTRFGQPRYFLHPEEDRGFSVRETARIQTFPDSFEFEKSNAASFRMIGNAVPPLFAKSVAENVINIGKEL